MENINKFGIIAGILLILVVGFSLNYMNSHNQAIEIKQLDLQIAKSDNSLGASTGGLLFATDTKSPTVVRVSPMNNESEVGTHDTLVVSFSEPMIADSINKNTFAVQQRTTPIKGSEQAEYRSMNIDGTVMYDGLTATFTPLESVSFNPLQPSMENGNVFTVTVTTGAKDLAGNSLSEDYVWSFTTGGDAFNTDATTSQTG